jgi:stage V sporulation protein R
VSTELLKERFAELERMAHAAKLDPFDVHFFEVPAPVIWQTASYGLPTRYSHWSFGRVYQHQKTQGEMGFSKIYELILDNDPSLAFLDKNNTNTINLLIAAHCYLPGTLVQTTDGIKPIEEVRSHDVVYSKEGV